jgi:plastocyanin
MQMRRVLALATLVAAATAAACKGGEQSGGASADTPAAVSGTGGGAAPSSGGNAFGEQTPDAGGQIITVQMITDDKGNRFEPAEISAKRGDVIRYTLQAGVHNVHFLADSNAGRSGFPTQPSELLQLPGQTQDVKVTFASGKYFFQCDPHAALGMVGHVNVQ